VHSYGGYTTNLPLEDLLDGQAWIAYTYDGEDPRPSTAARPPARAAPVPVEERPSGCGHHAGVSGRAGVLESLGYHLYGDPWREQRTGATDLAGRDGGRGPRRDVDRADARAGRAGLAGHDAGQHVDVRLTAPDGYTAVRSYSIASVADGDRIEITVEQVRTARCRPTWPALRLSGIRWSARADRRLVRVAGGPDRAGAARGRRLGRRAADGDGAGPVGGGERRPVLAAVLDPATRVGDLSRRTAASASGGLRSSMPTPGRTGGWPRPPGASTRRCWPQPPSAR